jgi:serine/threonine protein kinase
MTTGDQTAKSPPPSGEARPPASKPPPSSRKSRPPSMRPGGPSSLLGTILSGRYRIDKILGEGGMGIVYAAEHLHMRKRLAVKILHPEMSRLPEVVERFEREAMAAAHIDHPNVAAATDFGKLDDGSFFLVLEYIEGEILRDVVGRARLEAPRALHIMEQVAAALGRAHAIGIVHRDLKPENVMLILKDGDPDFVKVLDFGIAKVPVAELGTAAPSDPARPVLTQLGMVYGTPEYMAPEQALGQAVDARADLYALGVMAYEMLTGVRPFDHESKVTLLGMQVTAPVPPMSKSAPDANVPPEVEAIVTRLLAKEASSRYQDARELIDATSRALGRTPNGPPSLPRVSSSISRASLPGTAKIAPAVTADPVPSRASLAFDRLAVVSGRLSGSVSSGLAEVPMKTWAIVGASLGALTFLILFVAVLAGGSTPHPATTSDAPAPIIKGTGGLVASVKAAAAADRDVAAARQALAQGDAPGALKLLAPIAQEFPGRGDVHHAMEQAYALEHDTKSVLDEAKLWLSADPNAASDQELADALRGVALGKEFPDAALALLEGPMGSLGVDVLYDFAYAPKAQGPIVARAKQALALPEVRGHASEAALVALDLHTTTSCEGRRAILPRARDAGDARAATLLTPLTATRGCGFLATRDCWACLHRDGALKDALAAIAGRANTNP